MLLCKNKRGAILGINLGELIGIILAVSLILVIMALFTNIGAFFLGKEKLAATEENFNTMAAMINRVLDDPSDFAAVPSIPFFISNNYVLVGFNREGKAMDVCQAETAAKPMECGDSACICIFEDKGDYNFDAAERPSNPAVPCRRFKDADFIIGFSYYDRSSGKFNHKAPEQIYKNMLGYPIKTGSDDGIFSAYTYASLFIYGQCEDWVHIPVLSWLGVTRGDVNFGTQNLYIEKFKSPSNKKTYITIAADLVMARERHAEMRQLYGISIESITRAYDNKEYLKVFLQAEDFLQQRNYGKSPETDEARMLKLRSYLRVIELSEKDTEEAIGILEKILLDAGTKEDVKIKAMEEARKLFDKLTGGFYEAAPGGVEIEIKPEDFVFPGIKDEDRNSIIAEFLQFDMTEGELSLSFDARMRYYMALLQYRGTEENRFKAVKYLLENMGSWTQKDEPAETKESKIGSVEYRYSYSNDEFLYLKGEAFEKAGLYGKAIGVWDELIGRYPSSGFADKSLDPAREICIRNANKIRNYGLCLEQTIVVQEIVMGGCAITDQQKMINETCSSLSEKGIIGLGTGQETGPSPPEETAQPETNG